MKFGKLAGLVGLVDQVPAYAFSLNKVLSSFKLGIAAIGE